MPKQAAPERPTDVPIVVLTPLIDATFPCCPGCEVLNEPVTELVGEVVLIAKDMGVLLVCNLLQFPGANIPTNVSGNRASSDGLPSLDLLERRLETTNRETIPLMPRSSGLGWATREMGAAFTMAGASYLPWLAGTLEEHPGEGYWLLLRSDSEGIRMLPETEGRGVGNASGQ